MSDPVPFRPFQAGTQPPLDHAAYGSTRLRHPTRPLRRLPQTVSETTGPAFTPALFPEIADMTRQGQAAPLGERIIVAGRVTDEDGRPVPNTMIEVWQANAAGRYAHPRDTHDAPADPNFPGEGRIFTDAEGHYRFVSIKPGAYPWRNHHNAWRPVHIHFSLFGSGFAQRLITQMYFPGDPLLALDPIYHAVPDAAARERLVSRFDLDITEPEWALGYRFDIVLRGRGATPFEDGETQ
ncbi:protocatechuate 3,4-dioxygenase subunit beta [Roseicella frigidaeris]|uniref:Protocatechuate 3,4-dioxygenase subunit beta n=1 Tax=Roseicella frigidaeris TaxID=2230885 RepID=A0A327M1K6_9PROT|nr:protocatechuate 3,4-dioxygenase subunit beta [Roseicella frigidaeris]RAI56205.1 protocatechuate 3,4-dioxygenase subunit beta [Roseicella frigidaeris]